jgi:mRNA-degrading endonuclease RelE of RelBE toxin-antitoxin system
MNPIQKALKKFSAKELVWVKNILIALQKNKTAGLDIKKLKGRDDIFRVRKGNLRVIYRRVNQKNLILHIGRRNEGMYDL